MLSRSFAEHGTSSKITTHNPMLKTLATRTTVVSTACSLAMLFVLGCHSAPPPTPTKPTIQTAQYPPRPTTPPPPFKLFHQTDTTLTLVTKETATDDEITAILYQLRDAATNHTFAALKLPQAFIDKRDPIVWFHLYRGPKCAPEKYTTPPPCGPSYHAAGDFTYGSFTNKDQTDAALIQDENHQTQLWNPKP